MILDGYVKKWWLLFIIQVMPSIVIAKLYKCKDGTGSYTFSDTPCSNQINREELLTDKVYSSTNSKMLKEVESAAQHICPKAEAQNMDKKLIVIYENYDIDIVSCLELFKSENKSLYDCIGEKKQTKDQKINTHYSTIKKLCGS